MYLPGKVMMSGSKYPVTRVMFDSLEWVVSNDSRSIDATAATPRWLPGVNTMFHRRMNHNLVVMPNAHVAAIGGTQRDRANHLAILQPEFWDPNVTGTNQRGQWYQTKGGELLASHQLKRGYHSGCLMLPTGQLLLNGGNDDGEDQNRAEIFCPPYLFKPDGSLAPRPSMSGYPTVIRPGVTFTICTANPADVTRACLITPGAPTHGFDQNQRYIPLAITPATSGTARLFATAPADSNIAPPGWYLLFLTGSRDASGTYPDVPSIGQWVRVERPGYTDACDAVAPATITDLAVDVLTPDAVFLSGTTSDDGSLYASGPVTGYWSSSNHGQTTATFTNGDVFFDVTGLVPSTNYTFSYKTRDDAPGPNWSGISNSVTITTPSGGGGGGGYSLEPSSGAGLSSMIASEGGLVAETASLPGGGWSIVLRRVADVDGFDAPDAGSIVLQDGSTAAGWQTKRRFPVPGDVLGLCALKHGRRTLVLGSFAVQRVATQLDGANGALALASAAHSRLGALSISGPDPLAVSLEAGEELTLRYAPDAGAAGAGSEFATVGIAGAATGFSRRPGRSPTPDLPERTALRQSTPNPFSQLATIGFELPRPSSVRIEVFDLHGRRIRTLTDREWPAGRHAVTWDRLTDRGERLSSGVFLYRMTADGFRDQRKMVLGSK